MGFFGRDSAYDLCILGELGRDKLTNTILSLTNEYSPSELKAFTEEELENLAAELDD